MTDLQKRKLRKLLALLNVTVDNGSTLAEEKSAKEKAEAIIAKYGFDTDNLSEDTRIEDEFYVDNENGKSYKNIPSWAKQLYIRTYTACGVYTFTSKRAGGYDSVTGVGRESDLEIADYFVDVIREQLFTALEEYRYENAYLTAKERSSFLESYVLEATAKLKKLLSNAPTNHTSENGVTVVDSRGAEYDKNQKHALAKYNIRSARYSHRHNPEGSRAGANANLNTGVNGGKAPLSIGA